MKRLVLIAMLAGGLAACGDAAEESDDTAAAPAATETVAAEESSAGNWDVTLADGTTFMAMLGEDGTYQDMDADGNITASGTWEDRDDGKTCFDSEGEEEPVVCYTVGEPTADGSMVATPDDGSEPLTIKRSG